jgi:hypothetical protein
LPESKAQKRQEWIAARSTRFSPSTHAPWSLHLSDRRTTIFAF